MKEDLVSKAEDGCQSGPKLSNRTEEPAEELPRNEDFRKKQTLLKQEGFALYEKEPVKAIGMKAFFSYKGKMTECTVAGYYNEGGWLVTVKNSSLAISTDEIYVRTDLFEKGDS